MSSGTRSVGPRPARDERPLDFAAEREAETTSWVRADPTVALIERWGRYGYLITLPGGSAHFAAIGRRSDGTYVGWCKCKGFQHHDGPCAHLCTLYKADTVGVEAVNERPVTVEHAVEAEQEDVAEEHAEAQRSGDVFLGEVDRLDVLTDAQQKVYVACDWNGFAPCEIAEHTDRAPTTIRTHLYRARKRLAEADDGR